MARLLIAAVILGACGPQQAALTPTPTAPVSATASPPRPLDFVAIQRVDSRTGFVAGWRGTGLGLGRTTDGGASWTKLAVPANELTELRFINAATGWAIGSGDRYVLLRTDDGGATWRETLSVPFPGGGPVLHDLQAVDGMNAWVVVGDATCAAFCGTEIRATSDGGKTWRTLYQGQVGPIRFVTPRRGWIAAYGAKGVAYGADGGNLLVTSDGGATWTNVLPAQPIVAIDAIDELVVWALARDGAYCSASSCAKYELFRSTDAGATWTSAGNPKLQLADSCTGGRFAGPHFASLSRGWFGLNEGAGGVSGIGSIIATDDGGTTWRCARAQAEVALLSAADADHVWAVDSGRGTRPMQLLASDDGGQSWRALDLTALR
jgi:photosystem II stability/assembly factor-like uncharacterized protein